MSTPMSAPITPSNVNTTSSATCTYVNISVFGDNYEIVYTDSDAAKTDAHLRKLAIDWACDNVGKNNFVDTLNDEKLPSKAGFFVQYVKVGEGSTVKRINAIQVTASEESGWTGKYTTFNQRVCGFFATITSKIPLMSRREHETYVENLSHRVNNEYEMMMNDYRDQLLRKDRRVNELNELCNTLRASLDAESDKYHELSKIHDKYRDSVTDLANSLQDTKGELDVARDEIEQLKWRASRCTCESGFADAAVRRKDKPVLRRAEKAATSQRSIETSAKEAYERLRDELISNPPILKPIHKSKNRLLLEESTDDLEEVIKNGTVTIRIADDPWSDD